MKRISIPWVAVLLFCVVCWPIGLLLLWLKMRSDLKAIMIASGVMKVLAWVLVGLFGLCFLGTIIDEGWTNNGAALGFTILLSGAFALLTAASFIKKNAHRYKRFINIIVNDGITQIDEIGRIMNLPDIQVLYYLEKMINRNYLPKAYISEVNHEIVLPGQPWSVRKPAEEWDIVYCKNCGAHKEVVVGRIDTCDFCGSKLKAG